MKLADLIEQHKTIRVIGFDDTPFSRQQKEPVNIGGIICAGTRFEGMLWSQVEVDGWNATEILTQLLLNSKFLPQLHLLLLDGLCFGGFNVIDLPLLHHNINLPCVSVMRKYPKFTAIKHALSRISDGEKRLEIMEKAGEIYHLDPFYFQVIGENPEIISKVLPILTDRGKVPEALRLAHLIGSAIIKGESGKQA